MFKTTMKKSISYQQSLLKSLFLTCGLGILGVASAAPTVSRLTPPSELFSTGQSAPIVARFLPDQRFDLQATIRPDDAAQSITQASFYVNGIRIEHTVALKNCQTGCTASTPKNASIATIRSFSMSRAGVHTFEVRAQQTDGQQVTAKGQFEVVVLHAGGQKVKNIIIMLGDGMGAAQRTAARIVSGGYAQGHAIKPLAMDQFPISGQVKTSSLNSLITDSAPGMAAYVSGNKGNNNEEGVFPDDTTNAFDNPRIEYLSEYLHRTQGKALGLVTTSDVFDATPAANAIHTSNRGAGTGIVDQFFDDRKLTGLSVLMGGGRKWFLPASTPGSARSDSNDYAFSDSELHTSEIVKKWGASSGKLDKERDLIGDFQASGFKYVSDKTSLDAIDISKTNQLLGLFSYSNMNVALDKIDGRRNIAKGIKGRVVDDFGFPDQPMLDEMTQKALAVLEKNKKGFVLMVEGASIDKQAHNMDTERWILDTIEFDRAIAVVQEFAKKNGETLVIVTADHECSGVALIGASTVSDAKLQDLIKAGGVSNVRDQVVGVYEKAGFPKYKIGADGYPQSTDIDYRLLVGYGGNSDRTEDWRTNPLPLQDSQQPLIKSQPLSAYPVDPMARDAQGGFTVTGQVPGNSGVHTASDIPLSAMGPGAWAFTGVQDNTDIFFAIGQAVIKGVLPPKTFSKNK
jgi:alkaline phosphatase